MWSRRWRRLLQTLDVFHSWTSLKCHFVWNFDLLFYFPKINGSLISITHLSDRYCSTTTLEGWVVTTSIWFHPLSIPLALHLFIHYICPAPIIHCICARSITFLWGDNCICAWSITFVWGALHGSSVYPTLHQEWTLNKHTLLAAVFHQYIPINHHRQSIIIRSGQYRKPSFKRRIIRLLRSS